MQRTTFKQFILIGVLPFFLAGCILAPKKNPKPKELSNGILSSGPCVSKFEKVKDLAAAEENKSVVLIGISCQGVDYLKDVEVKLSNDKKTYKKIAGQLLGCIFSDITHGKYTLEVETWVAKKFEPVEVELESGRFYSWEIILCKKP